jgi:tetratricopeptide (TPR) repeat protein
MADYDMALDYDPNNFLGHYNRGLLRAQVGDDNRAIKDFDFVLKLEPDNLMALYNRALLLENTGNPRAAIRDYSKVIEQYPNFWVGLQQRASCYRKLGMTRQAEQDEFRILKAQIDKRYGKQPRLSKKQMRKRSDEDIEKYNQLAVADEEDMQHEYQSEYRGRVQNRKVDMDYMPMYCLSTKQKISAVRHYVTYDRQVDSMNHQLPRNRQLYIVAGESDIKDPSVYIKADSTSALALWIRAISQWQDESIDLPLRTANLIDHLTRAIQLAPANAFLYYNRGNAYVKCLEFQQAIADYSKAIQLDGNMAEAYYNRGLARLANKQQIEGNNDLSKAGELGLYTAYSILKRQRNK